MLPDTFNTKIVKLGGIYRLDVLYLRGVDDGGAEDVGFECLTMALKEALKRVFVIAFGSASYGFSVEI